MALTSVDERELLAPLIGGMAEVPVWDTFLRRLIARTRATQVCLLLRQREATHLPPVLRRIAARAEEPEPDFARLDELAGHHAPGARLCPAGNHLGRRR